MKHSFEEKKTNINGQQLDVTISKSGIDTDSYLR